MVQFFRGRLGGTDRRLGRVWGLNGLSGLFAVNAASETPIYRRRGLLGSLWAKTPSPLKAYLTITGLAAATVILAPTLIILAGPPLICGAWWINRQRKRLKDFASQLHDQRWKEMASFHLQSSPRSSGPEASQMMHKIPTFARISIEDALARNTQNIIQQLRLSPAAGSQKLQFGEIQSLSQDFRMDTNGMREQMSVAEYPLFVQNALQCVVRLVSRGNQGANERKFRIELVGKNGNVVVLNSIGGSDFIIEGHGTRVGP